MSSRASSARSSMIKGTNSHPPALLESTFQKQGGSVKNWKQRYFRLYKEYLQYYESSSALVPKGSIFLPGAQLSIYAAELFPNTQFAFGVTPVASSRTYIFSASANSERMQWIRTMKPLCLSSPRSQPTSLMEGFLTKQSGGVFKNWQKRWLVLLPNQLQYYKERPNPDSPVEMSHSIDLSVPFTIAIDKQASNSEFIFTLSPSSEKERNYRFASISDAERQSWVAILQTLNTCAQVTEAT